MNIPYLKRLLRHQDFYDRLPQEIRNRLEKVKCGCKRPRILRRILTECGELLSEFEGYIEKVEG